MHTMEPWQYWLIGGIVLCILEMFTGDFVLLGLGVAGISSGLAAYGGASTNLQLITFGIIALIIIFGIRPIAKKHFYKSSDPRLSNAKAMIGKTATVILPITGPHGAGRVKLGSEEWRAIASDTGDFPSGTTVRIESIDGATLIVSPL
jgi:membrane protein implicated in regulation of membrane protease activity